MEVLGYRAKEKDGSCLVMYYYNTGFLCVFRVGFMKEKISH